MQEILFKQKDVICKIYTDLKDIHTFLIGNIPMESTDKEELNDKCVDDTLRNNSIGLEKIIGELNIIIDYLKGGKK